MKASVFLILLPSALMAEPVVPLAELAGKSPDGVSLVLGPPIGEESVPQGLMRYYRPGDVRIIFVDGRCCWVLIPDLDPVKMGAGALEALGLDRERPTFEDFQTVSWQPHSIYPEISITGWNGEAKSACVRVR